MPVAFILIYPIMFAAIIGFWFLGHQKRKKYNAEAEGKVQEFLVTNPDAAKIKLIGKSDYSYTNGSLTVDSVDGAEPMYAFEDNIYTLYVAPGSHILSASYFYVKQSALSKRSKHTTIGPLNLEITAEANQTYALTYDIDSNEFNFNQSA